MTTYVIRARGRGKVHIAELQPPSRSGWLSLCTFWTGTRLAGTARPPDEDLCKVCLRAEAARKARAR